MINGIIHALSNNGLLIAAITVCYMDQGIFCANQVDQHVNVGIFWFSSILLGQLGDITIAYLTAHILFMVKFWI